MIRIENRLGSVEISNNFFAELVSYAASSCFGVSGMVASGATQGIRQFTGAQLPSKGVQVKVNDGALIVDLHIEVAYGVNITAVVRSIISEVRYAVEDITGFKVTRVNVFVDAMKCE